MADSSMDIMCDFDVHELTNAIDQARREISVRYDLKSLGIEIKQGDDEISVTTPSEISLNAAWDVVLQKIINRNLSPKLLDRGEMEKLGGADVRYTAKITKDLDSETAKKVSQIIRDNFKKVKSSIQGQTVRVSSKSRDDLQAVITMLKANKDIDLPLKFGNYR